MRLIAMCVCVLAVGCGEDSRLTDYMDDDVPAGKCEDTEGEACETGGEGEACTATQECGGDFICAATFNGDIGNFECQSACIPTMDETRWCVDDSGCCDALATCSSRGYCMIADTVDTGIDSGIDSGSDDVADSGSSDAGTSDAGTSDTGTETGASTETDTESGTESSTGVVSG